VVGNGRAVVVDLAGSARLISRDLINPMGLMAAGGGDFIIGTGDVTLIRLNIAGGVHELARLNLQGSISELCRASDDDRVGYLWSHYQAASGQTKGIVIRFRY